MGHGLAGGQAEHREVLGALLHGVAEELQAPVLPRRRGAAVGDRPRGACTRERVHHRCRGLGGTGCGWPRAGEGGWEGEGQGCMRMEGVSEAAPEAVRQAVGGGCQSGWGRLLSDTNAVETGTCRQGDSGWA